MVNAEAIQAYEFFRHLYPDFGLNHVIVYKCLWGIEPVSGEKVIQETGLSRSCVYGILKELVAAGLVKKTRAKPFGYYADHPMETYYRFEKKVNAKLLQGRERLKKLMEQNVERSDEKYLVRLDGNEARFIHLHTRHRMDDRMELLQIKKGIENHLAEKETKKLKAWQVVGRNH